MIAIEDKHNLLPAVFQLYYYPALSSTFFGFVSQLITLACNSSNYTDCKSFNIPQPTNDEKTNEFRPFGLLTLSGYCIVRLLW